MNHLLLARIALTLLCGSQGVATLAIDFNRTHASNPAWPRHARFHVVWQSVAVALSSLVQVVLIWREGPFRSEAFYLAALLAALSPLAFLSALLGCRIYDGALSDPNGIPPVQVSLGGKTLSVDMNLVAVVIALVALAVILAIYRA